MDKTNPQDLLDHLTNAAQELRTLGLVLAELADHPQASKVAYTLSILSGRALNASEAALS